MSDCGICLSNEGADETVELLHEDEEAIARKTHPCCECCREIPAGTPYQLNAGTCGDERVEYRTCLICAEIRRAFACHGWVYCSMWEDLEYAFEDGINDSCFSKLQTVEAKKYLRERWMKWKGLAA